VVHVRTECEASTDFVPLSLQGPLISVSGTKITVSGASGHLIDADGAKWWDGKGSNGGKTKPKVRTRNAALATP
jgi:galacturan 1,4-alpha-galacturonidase